MNAHLFDSAGAEVYADVRLVSRNRVAITFDTGVVVETDAVVGADRVDVMCLATLRRVAALEIQRGRAAQPGGEHQQRGHEHQRNQKRAQQHGAKVAPRRAGRQSP